MERLYHSSSIEAIVKDLDANLETGLSSEDVSHRLEQYGSNELVSAEKASPFKMFLLQFKDFLVFLLLGLLSFLYSLGSTLKH